ncbi:ParB/RepB/Spo0J family partition protein [Kitasatospora sp. NPDC057541]|uniref:ParB/RepB/Spo0J family partition protein n=1 Tax=unclassified Kitasatospora TaxID=2633591 RepID=UPI0036A3E53E
MTATATPARKAAARRKKPAAPAPVWARALVADLIAHGNVPAAADPELTADITKHGITDPLWIEERTDGTLRVLDGLRRLAAAAAAGLESVPYSPLPQIRITELTAHPGNLREDLKLTAAFIASLSRGVDIRLRITQGEDGRPLVVDGHRRLAGAKRAGLSHVPYEWVRADAAGQRLEMLSTAVHREPLKESEQLAGLFSAAELGASTADIATASGRTQKDVKRVVTASGINPVKALRSAVPAIALTLDQMEAMADLEDDPATMESLAQVAAGGGNLTFAINHARTRQRADRAAAEHRAELAEAGARIRETDELSEKSSRLTYLRDADGRAIDPADHAATCRGAVWVRSYGSERYTQFCVNWALYEHRIVLPNEGKPRRTAAEAAAIKAGNIEWQAATETRRAWLKALFAKGRKYSAKEAAALQRAVSMALIGGFASIPGRYGDHRTLRVLGELLGVPAVGNGAHLTDADFAKLADTATAARVTALGLARLTACGEMDATKEAWRTDPGANQGRRDKTRQYLRILADLGYEPVPIERAVLDDKPYKPKV